MLNEVNATQAGNFTAKQLAEFFRSYLNDFLFVSTWYASIFGDVEEDDEVMSEFYNLCKAAHNLGI